MQKLSLKISVLSFVVLLSMMTPATIVHELGHSAVCTIYGYKTDIRIDAISATSFCHSDEMKDNYFYYSFGGLLAFIVLLIPLLQSKLRNTKWIFIPLLTLATSHGINSIFETLIYDYYISDNSVLPSALMLISLGIFFGLLIKYGRVVINEQIISSKLIKRPNEQYIIPTNLQLEDKPNIRMLNLNEKTKNDIK